MMPLCIGVTKWRRHYSWLGVKEWLGEDEGSQSTLCNLQFAAYGFLF